MEPPTLKEVAARVVRIRVASEICLNILPYDLFTYLRSANQCVNPKCCGVYFESCVELVKFVDFCGKYRVPLLQYLWFVFFYFKLNLRKIFLIKKKF